jgi:hypothetical protein
VPRRPTPPRFRPRLEVLEDRTVPTTLTVTNNLDSGPGSLRDDIAHAKNGDTINFAPSLDGQTITLTSGELIVNKSVTIQGPGADQLTISGDNLSRVFEVTPHVTVELSGLTITGGNGMVGGPGHTGFDAYGGAIFDFGNLTVSDCTITGNSAVFGGGGIAVGAWSPGLNVATLTVNDCIISGNSAQIGGGIYNGGTTTVSGGIMSGNSATGAAGEGGAICSGLGALTVSGCMITGNSATLSGGGFFIAQGTATVSTSYFCGNMPDNIVGSYTDGGGNTFM